MTPCVCTSLYVGVAPCTFIATACSSATACMHWHAGTAGFLCSSVTTYVKERYSSLHRGSSIMQEVLMIIEYR